MSPEPALTAIASAEPESEPQVQLDENEARRIDFIWALTMIGGLAAVFLLISLFGGVAVPVLLSLAVAYVLNAPVSWLERMGLRRVWGTVAVFAGVALVTTGAVLYLIPVVGDEASKLPDFFRTASTQVIPRFEAATGLSLPELLRQRTEQLGTEASDLVRSVGPTAAKLAARFAGNTARFVVTVLGLLVVPVISFFFLRDYPELLRRARSLLPRRSVALVTRRFAQVDEVLSAFVQGQISVGAILSVIYSVGLSAARIDMAIVIGVIAGFGNMVPYLGTAIGILLAATGMLLSWQGPWQLAVIVGTFLLAQLSEGLVITPRIVGEKVGLPPVVVIIAVLGFSELFGFVGVLLAVPFSAILKVVLEVVIERYRKSPAYAGTAPKR